MAETLDIETTLKGCIDTTALCRTTGRSLQKIYLSLPGATT